MNQLLLGPMMVLLFSGLTLGLVNTADHVSQKMLDYSQQMDSAVDCAFAGIDINQCAPNLLKVDFRSDLVELNATANKIIAEQTANAVNSTKRS